MPKYRTPAQLLQLWNFLAQWFDQEDLAVVFASVVVQPDLLLGVAGLCSCPTVPGLGSCPAVTGMCSSPNVVLNELHNARELGNLIVQVIVAVEVEETVEIV